MSPDGPLIVDIAIPVYNEQAILDTSIRTLQKFLDTRFPWTWQVTIVDNASTDDTWKIACALAEEFQDVEALHLDEKGRGRAIRAAWGASKADVVAYMDVDLSTELDKLIPLVDPLIKGEADLSLGTRWAQESVVTRGAKRKFISWSYNHLLKLILQVRFSDAMCGFKAARTWKVEKLLPEVKDNEWFFDTELLLLAQRSGYKLHEVPLVWVDDPDSRVRIIKTAWRNLMGIWRIARQRILPPLTGI